MNNILFDLVIKPLKLGVIEMMNCNRREISRKCTILCQSDLQIRGLV